MFTFLILNTLEVDLLTYLLTYLLSDVWWCSDVARVDAKKKHYFEVTVLCSWDKKINLTKTRRTEL